MGRPSNQVESVSNVAGVTTTLTRGNNICRIVLTTPCVIALIDCYQHIKQRALMILIFEKIDFPALFHNHTRHHFG